MADEPEHSDCSAIYYEIVMSEYSAGTLDPEAPTLCYARLCGKISKLASMCMGVRTVLILEGLFPLRSVIFCRMMFCDFSSRIDFFIS